MKLIVFCELARFMSIQRVSDFLNLSCKDNEAFAFLYNRELERRGKMDTVLQRIQERQLTLLMSRPQHSTEEWDAIWEEEYRGVSLQEPSTWSISKADIQLAKRFLYHYPIREDFDVGFKGRKRFPTSNKLLAAVLHIEGYEGTNTTADFDFDLNDFDSEDSDDDTEPDEGDTNGVAHIEDEDVDMGKPPASTFNPHTAVFSDLSRPTSAQRIQQTEKSHLKRPGPTDAEEAGAYRARQRRTRLEDSDYDGSEASDTDEDEDIPAVVQSRTSVSNRPTTNEQRRPRGRPKGSTSSNKKQLSPRKKFDSLADVDITKPLKTASYNLLVKDKKTRHPKKIATFKVAPTKLKQVLNAPSLSNSPGLLPEDFPSLPPPSKVEARSSQTPNNPSEAPSEKPDKRPAENLGKPIEAPSKAQIQGAARQVPTKPSPQVANSQPAGFRSQAQAQGFATINAPALPSMGIPRTQHTNPRQTQPQQSGYDPPPPPLSQPPNNGTNNPPPRPQGGVSAAPGGASTTTIHPNMRPGYSNQTQPQSYPPPARTPFSTTNEHYNGWLNANSSFTGATPDAGLLEKQKVNLQQPHPQQHGQYPGPPASTSSATAPSAQPPAYFDPATVLSSIVEQRNQDTASYQHLRHSIFSGPSTPTPNSPAWNYAPCSRFQSTPAAPLPAATRPNAPERRNTDPSPSVGRPVTNGSAEPTVIFYSTDDQVSNEPRRNTYPPTTTSVDPPQRQIASPHLPQIPPYDYAFPWASANQHQDFVQPQSHGISPAEVRPEARETTAHHDAGYQQYLQTGYNSPFTPLFAPALTSYGSAQLPAKAYTTGLGIFPQGANAEHQQHQPMAFNPYNSPPAPSQTHQNLARPQFYTTQSEAPASTSPGQTPYISGPQVQASTSATAASPPPKTNITPKIGEGVQPPLDSQQQTPPATSIFSTKSENTIEVIDLEEEATPNYIPPNVGRQIVAPTIKFESVTPNKASPGTSQKNAAQTSTPTRTSPVSRTNFAPNTSDLNAAEAPTSASYSSNSAIESPSTAHYNANNTSKLKEQVSTMRTSDGPSSHPKSSTATPVMNPQLHTSAEEQPNAAAGSTSKPSPVSSGEVPSKTPQSSPKASSIPKSQSSVATTPVDGSSAPQKAATTAQRSPKKRQTPDTPSDVPPDTPLPNSSADFSSAQQTAKANTSEKAPSKTAPADIATASNSTQQPPKKATAPVKATSKTKPLEIATASSSTQEPPKSTAPVKAPSKKATQNTKAANPPTASKTTKAPPKKASTPGTAVLAREAPEGSKITKPKTALKTSEASSSKAPEDSKPGNDPVAPKTAKAPSSKTPEDNKVRNPQTAPKTTKASFSKAPQTKKAAPKPAISQPSVVLPAKPAPTPKTTKAPAKTREYTNIPAPPKPPAEKKQSTKRAASVPKNAKTKSGNTAGQSSSKATAAKAASYALIEELEEDLEAQKKLGTPSPILNERSRSEARAVKEAQEGKGSGFSVVVKQGGKKAREDEGEGEEKEAKKIIKKAKVDNGTGGNLGMGAKKGGGKQGGGKRAREKVEEEAAEKKVGKVVKKAKK
jgi:hypothetical protein